MRPFLVMSIADALHVPQEQSNRVAVAIEYIHTYSLIHDDLPAMDNSPVRRNHPTCHRRFNDATAILAGDALQPMAFEILASPETHPKADIRCRLISELAQAIGEKGMVLGQQLDIEAQNVTYTFDTIRQMQDLKTGALLRYSCIAPGILSGLDPSQLEILGTVGTLIGRIFQITDDLLDLNGTAQDLGKPTHQDDDRSTFVTTLGETKARQLAQEYTSHALTELSRLQTPLSEVEAMTTYLLERVS